jgi:putative aldouronate transport system substrate-binding protein
MARYENYHFLQFGQEGVSHDIVDGVPKIKTVTGPWIQNSGGNLDYTLCINGYDMRDPALTAKVLANSYPVPPEHIVEAYRITALNAKPGPTSMATLTVAGPLTQTLVDQSTVIYVQSITASPTNFDRVYDTGINDWLRTGAQAVLDERRAKYIAP